MRAFEGEAAVMGIVGVLAVVCLLAQASFAKSAAAPGAKDPTPPPGMAYVPPGELAMGISPERQAELAKAADVHPSLVAAPQRKVAVKGFFLDRCEVTNAQYAEFLRETNHPVPRYWNRRYWNQGKKLPPGADHLPVVNVGIADARAFAKWAGKRLPTEAEWEWAARGPAGRMYPWGEEWVKGAANLLPSGIYGPAPVGAFAKDKTPEGVYDMAGNVSEWVADRFGRKGQGNRVCVIRGGNWMFSRPLNAAGFIRTNSSYQMNVFPRVGFRCAMDIGEPAPRKLPLPDRVKPKVDQAGRKRFAPPSGGRAGITMKPQAHRPHVMSFYVPQMTDLAVSLQMPENVRYRGGHFKTHMLKDIVWKKVSGPRGTGRACHVKRPQDGYEYKASAIIVGNRVEIDFRFTNTSDKALTSVTPTFCLGADQLDYRFIDPEHERVNLMTDAGVLPFCKVGGGMEGRPLFRWTWVKEPNKPADPANPRIVAGVIGMTRRDGKWTYVKVFEGADSVGSNDEYSCIHSEGRWDRLGPGEEKRQRGAIFFLKMPADKALPYAWEEFQKILAEDDDKAK